MPQEKQFYGSIKKLVSDVDEYLLKNQERFKEKELTEWLKWSLFASFLGVFHWIEFKLNGFKIEDIFTSIQLNSSKSKVASNILCCTIIYIRKKWDNGKNLIKWGIFRKLAIFCTFLNFSHDWVHIFENGFQLCVQ